MKIDRTSADQVSVFKYGNGEKEYRATLKQTLLLTTAIFLMIAPAPDSSDIAEFSANFIVTASHTPARSRDADRSVSLP